MLCNAHRWTDVDLVWPFEDTRFTCSVFKCLLHHSLWLTTKITNASVWPRNPPPNLLVQRQFGFHHFTYLIPSAPGGAQGLDFSPPLWPAWGCAVFQEFQPAPLRSTSTTRCQVVFGRQRFLFPSGVQHKATAQSCVGFFLSTWPIQFHLLLLTWSLIFSAVAICSFVGDELLPSDFEDPPETLGLEDVSSSTDKTKLLKRDALVFLLMSVAYQMLDSLFNDALASAMLFLTSAVLPAPLVTLAPRYVNLWTSSTSSWPRLSG